MFFFFFFFLRRRDCSPDKPTCGWIGSKITMKGPDFWQICILAEYDQHRTMPTVWDSIKKSLFSKLAFIFFSYHDQFPVFLTSSHHCKLCPQHLYRRTSSSFGDFALKHSLHLKAINHATITTRCVTVLLFISRFQVATLHLCLK